MTWNDIESAAQSWPDARTIVSMNDRLAQEPGGAPLRWNVPLVEAPADCDVLVVGAGPAGSACARWLGRIGWSVVLVDMRRFPRDKVCGDGLVPDTLAALDRLEMRDAVIAAGVRLEKARCVAPSQRAIEVPGDLAVVPRRAFDECLARGAVEAGAVLVAPARFEASLNTEGRVSGACLIHDGLRREIRARWVVLATGAAVGPLAAAGVCRRDAPSGIAVRQYVRHPALAAELEGMRFVWHGALRGGYGWIFPGPDGVCNVGVGMLSPARPAGLSGERLQLRELFDRFRQVDPVAARLLAEGECLGPLKGAPLRCSLEGTDWTRPGLLVAGEAAGSTYAFSGEGIGKAMECGIAAAESLVDADAPPFNAAGANDAAVEAGYRQRLTALLPRFEMYRRAASFNRSPWLIDLVIWRAQGRPRVIAGLADILAERRMPGSLLSWRGLRALWRA
jgi:menaquinone-9 beta-reductase